MSDLMRIAIAFAEIEGEEVVHDQPCAFGQRLGGHAVYCTNDAWAEGPRKCRRTWYTGGEVKDEDCEGFKLNETRGEP